MWSWFKRSAATGSVNGDTTTTDHSPLIKLSLGEMLACGDTQPAGLHQSGMPRSIRSGELPGRKRGTGLELDNISLYQPGDDVRHIDWRATARTGRTHTRRFRMDVQRAIVLVVDLRPCMFFGTQHRLMAKSACLTAALQSRQTPWNQSLGWACIGNNTAQIQLPARGRRARLQQFKLVADHYQTALDNATQTPRTLASALHGLPGSLPADTDVVLFSDLSTPGEDISFRLREFGTQRLHAVVIEDVLMREPPTPGHYPVSDSENSSATVFPISRSSAKRYHDHADQAWHHLRSTLKDSGVVSVSRTQQLPLPAVI